MSLQITINEHSSIRLQGESAVIYCDPFHIKNATHDADVVLITHTHYDHFSPDDVKKIINTQTVLLAPDSCVNEIKGKGFRNVFGMLAGETKTIDAVRVQSVPAYNQNKPFHPKQNGWLGYVVTLDNETVYIAGDTDALSENETILCDVAMVPVGGTYTMDNQQAADLVNRLCPKTAIPTHYGSVVGDISAGDSFAKSVKKEIAVKLLIQ